MENIIYLPNDIPQEYSQFQVGGHKGSIIEYNGKIFKKAKQSEIDFYKWLYDANKKNRNIEKLKSLLPKFLGTNIIDGVECINLENLHYGYEYPNIVDVKLGKVTCHEKASPSKIERKRLKALDTTSFNLGFRISGILINDSFGNNILRITKPKANSLFNSSNVKDYFVKLITLNGKVQKEIIYDIIKETQKILDFFKSQSEKKFYATSLYYVFGKNKKFQVRFIDMAYSFDSDGEFDFNTMEGIEGVINMWKSILEDEKN